MLSSSRAIVVEERRGVQKHKNRYKEKIINTIEGVKKDVGNNDVEAAEAEQVNQRCKPKLLVLVPLGGGGG